MSADPAGADLSAAPAAAAAYRHFQTVAEAIAREAGALLNRYRFQVNIEYKGEADLVTRADRDSETLITRRLRDAFPDHALVAEEGARAEAAGEYRWWVDPLDGTTNFAHGLPIFAVSLGLEHQGRMVAGVVYNPAIDEMFSAVLGGGATLNGVPCRVSPQPNLAAALLGTGFPSQKRHKNPNIHFYQYFSLRTHGMRRLGSAALDLCYTACGRFEGFWELNLQPWDVAAGKLIVTEAGGQVSDLLGQPHHLRSPEILATNGLLHGPILAAFAGMFAGQREPMADPAAYLQSRPQPA